jgi:hypothetical protein
MDAEKKIKKFAFVYYTKNVATQNKMAFNICVKMTGDNRSGELLIRILGVMLSR